MPGFVVTAVFAVSGGVPSGGDVLASAWGPGHRMSYCDGGALTLVAEVVADDRAQAFEVVLSRAEQGWEACSDEPLPPPSTLTVQPVVPQPKLCGGLVGRGPDGVLADFVGRRAARLRAMRAALTELENLTPGR